MDFHDFPIEGFLNEYEYHVQLASPASQPASYTVARHFAEAAHNNRKNHTRFPRFA